MNLANYIENRLKYDQNRKLNNKRKSKILLMTHLIAGYPSLDDNWRMLEAMGEADVDLVEIQMPFSEPTADGPLFVKANQEALRNGVCWKSYFDLMKRASDEFNFPILMMGYYNTVFSMGLENFCISIKKNGGKGFIIPDLPIEEFGELFNYSQNQGINPIMLCTPTNTDQRLSEICAKGSGFIYCVARKGVTGKNTKIGQSEEIFLKKCKQFSDLPMAIGFGISSPDDLKQLHGKAEIAVIGSALLKTWENEGENGYRNHIFSLASARE